MGGRRKPRGLVGIIRVITQGKVNMLNLKVKVKPDCVFEESCGWVDIRDRIRDMSIVGTVDYSDDIEDTEYDENGDMVATGGAWVRFNLLDENVILFFYWTELEGA